MAQVLEVTPRERFEFQSIDNIGKCVTLHNISLYKLRVLRERAEEHDAHKIDGVIANLRETNEVFLDMLGDMGRRWDQPGALYIQEFEETPEVERERYTEELRFSAKAPLSFCRKLLERAKGPMRNLRARARDEKQTDEVRNLDNYLERLNQIGKDLRGKEKAIMELDLSRPRELDFARARELEVEEEHSNIGINTQISPQMSLHQARINFPDDKNYTYQSLVEELTLIERHARDGSWKLCTCIPGKHLPNIAGLSSEGFGFSDSDEERKFMESLMTEARLMKRDIDRGIIRGQDHFDQIRAWARESRKRIERKIWVGEYATEIEYVENKIPQSVLQLVEDLEGVGFERENLLSLPDLEEEMALKMVGHLCKKYKVPMPKGIRFTDSCNPLMPNAVHIQHDDVTKDGIKNRADLDELVFCRGGVTAFAVAHEFEHYRSHFDGNLVADEGDANRFAIKEVRNHLYTPLEGGNIHIEAKENKLLGKSMSLKMTKAQSQKGFTAVAGLATAKMIDYFDPQLTAALGPIGTPIGKIALGALAAYYGLTRLEGLGQDFLLFGGAELAVSEIWKQVMPTTLAARAPVPVARGPVAMPLAPGRAEVYPGASSTIRAAAPFMRTFAAPTRLTAGYPQVAQADGKFIQIRV